MCCLTSTHFPAHALPTQMNEVKVYSATASSKSCKLTVIYTFDTNITVHLRFFGLSLVPLPPPHQVWNTMASRVLLCVMVVMGLAMVAQAADPELTTDFFVPAGTDKAILTGNYFTSTVFRKVPEPVAPATFAATRLTSETFPVLTGLGVSHALVKYLPGGTNPPHTHPRGTETLLVREGTLIVGLLDTSNKLYTQLLQPGDLFVFPRGLVHYQINLGTKPVVAYAAFSSSNPGTVSLPVTLFGSGIPDYELTAAFKVDVNVINRLQAAQGQK